MLQCCKFISMILFGSGLDTHLLELGMHQRYPRCKLNQVYYSMYFCFPFGKYLNMELTSKIRIKSGRTLLRWLYHKSIGAKFLLYLLYLNSIGVVALAFNFEDTQVSLAHVPIFAFGVVDHN